jgi:hypothetical protein
VNDAAQILQRQQPGEFLFRANAVAAGGYLTTLNRKPVDLDEKTVTTHGESCLPLIGGVAHSLIKKPKLPFAKFIEYGPCETFLLGVNNSQTTATTLRASVRQVRVKTSPSREDNVPDVKSISFQAGRFSIEVKSIHPQEGLPHFELIRTEASDMFFVFTATSGKATTTSIRLGFDDDLISLGTVDDLDQKFLTDRKFFDAHAYRVPTKEPPIFGKSRFPRTEQGYHFTSIVNKIFLGDREIEGNVLDQPGFGKIYFGAMLADPYSRRISMARIKMGSNPAGAANFSGIETNGIWK